MGARSPRCGLAGEMDLSRRFDRHAAQIRDGAEEMKSKSRVRAKTQKSAPVRLRADSAGFGRGFTGSQVAFIKAHRGWILLLISSAILLAVLCWNWNRGWHDLESGVWRNDVEVRPQERVPEEVMEKLVTHRVDPDYPAAARAQQLQGVIVLDIVVGRDGSVANVHPQNGPDILAQAAMDALRWWRFRPYLIDGQPVAVETTVAVEFKP
jgi:TonB family protein